MKCGLCGATEYKPIDRMGKRGIYTVPFRDIFGLNKHKKLDHPTETATLRQKARDKRAQTKADAKDLAQRRLQAAQDAQHGVVLHQYRDGVEQTTRIPMRFFSARDAESHRYADPRVWDLVLRLDAEIEEKQKERDYIIRDAFYMGTSITPEENQRIQDIVDQVT